MTKKKPNRALMIVLGSVLGVLMLCVAAGVVGSFVGGNDIPSYTVISNDKGGNIVVAVDRMLTEDEARAIVAELRDKQTEEIGYYVGITCANGDTSTVDNRLGNARFGLGKPGQAHTGLGEGEISVEMIEGRACPAAASTPVVDTSLAAARGIPPIPDADTWTAYIADLKKLNPEIVGGREDRAVDRGRNACSAIFNWPDDHAKQVNQTNVRFTSPNHPDGFGAETAEKILAVVHARLCPSY